MKKNDMGTSFKIQNCCFFPGNPMEPYTIGMNKKYKNNLPTYLIELESFKTQREER